MSYDTNVVNLIKKLIAMASSPEASEAATALEIAKKRIAKAGIPESYFYDDFKQWAPAYAAKMPKANASYGWSSNWQSEADRRAQQAKEAAAEKARKEEAERKKREKSKITHRNIKSGKRIPDWQFQLAEIFAPFFFCRVYRMAGEGIFAAGPANMIGELQYELDLQFRAIAENAATAHRFYDNGAHGKTFTANYATGYVANMKRRMEFQWLNATDDVRGKFVNVMKEVDIYARENGLVIIDNAEIHDRGFVRASNMDTPWNVSATSMKGRAAQID